MKRHRRDGKNQQWFGGQQHLEAGWLVVVWAIKFGRVVETTGNMVVDRAGRDRERGEDAGDRHCGEQPEHHDGPERIGGNAGYGSGYRVYRHD